MGCFFFSSYSAKFAAVRPRTGLPRRVEHRHRQLDDMDVDRGRALREARRARTATRRQRRGVRRIVRYGLSTATLDRLRVGHALLVHGDLQRRNLRGIVELEDELRAAGDRNRAEQLRLRRRLPRQFVGRGAVDDERDFVRRGGAGDEVLAVQLERIRADAAAVGAFDEQPFRLFVDRNRRQHGHGARLRTR